MVLLIDNFDSFVFTLARYLRELGCETTVVRNDQIEITEIEALAPRAIILSPGPCTPNEAGITLDVVREVSPKIPMLGVCLGHQAIGAALGGRVIRASEPIHGMTSPIHHTDSELFQGIPSPFQATRYHSLIVEEQSLPDSLKVTARTADGTIMALEHVEHRLYGVQFHPESILTEYGHQLLANFLRLAEIPATATGLGDHVSQTPREPAVDFYALPIE